MTTSEKVSKKTFEFMLELITDLQANGETTEFCATKLTLIIMDTVGIMLDESLNSDVALIALNGELTAFEKHERIETLVADTISTCFKIMENSLPIDMQTQQIAKKDMGKVLDFAAAVKAKDGVRH